MKLQRYLVLVFVMFAALCLVVPAAASTLEVTTVGTSYDYGYSAPSGYAVAPYILQTSEGVNIIAMCIDYTHFQSGNPWTASVLTFDDLSGARFWNPLNPDGSLARYQRAAYLFSVVLSLDPEDPGSQTDIAALNVAAWYLFAPDDVTANELSSDDNFNARVNYWLSQSIPDGFNFGDYAILTPNCENGDNNCEQEHIIPVPEPATMTMMGTGLALAAFRRRKALRRSLTPQRM